MREHPRRRQVRRGRGGGAFDMARPTGGLSFWAAAVRRISALYDSYNAKGVDLYEELNLCDAGNF